MRRQICSTLLSSGFVLASGAAIAHHSFAMFDSDNPMEVVGKVVEFKFTSPHSFIYLEIKGPDGTATVWNLEGGAPSGLVREGWTSATIKAGDEIRVTIQPLRSGAPGGAWEPRRAKRKDGSPIVSQ